ncbi:MAG: glycosyltransferase [Flavobacteriaceae bacterium]|nr:glycosyltransferase [Flavobacteriaceae bacterium]
MKILYVIESLRSGGKERRLTSLIKKILIDENVEIQIVILSKDIHYKEIFNFNIKIHFLKRNFKKDIAIFFKFNKILNNFKPNIVHCWDNIAAIHFGPICKFKKIPLINSMISTAPHQDLTKPYSKRYLSVAISYPFSTVILANCKAGLESFKVPVGKGVCIYNGFDMDRIKNIVDKKIILEKFDIKTKYIIGMTASFSDKKDYNTFVRAGEKLLKKRKDITFLAIGDGPNLSKIKGSINKNNLNYFRFVGKQDDVESIVNICDIGVLISNHETHGEGISNALMEFMILKKPVIGSNSGGTKELIIDNETGFLIEAKNVDKLVEKIEFLLTNPERAKMMGENGKIRIEKYFSIDTMIEQTYKLYKENLN